MGDDELLRLAGKFIPNGLKEQNLGCVARQRAQKIGEVDLIATDIILRVTQFKILGSHAKVIILMCEVGVGSMVLGSEGDSDIIMVGSTLERAGHNSFGSGVCWKNQSFDAKQCP